jgi:hypothetical protein
VVAVFDDPGAATRALAALLAEGFADSAAAICPGTDFIRNWTDFVSHRGPIERLADLFPAEEQSAIEEYLADAESGASFVTVHAIAPEERNGAGALLKKFGAHGLRYYGDHTIIDLE